MGDRYYITGVQLGMLLVFNEHNNKVEIKKLLNKIMDEQFIGTKEEFQRFIKKWFTNDNKTK